MSNIRTAFSGIEPLGGFAPYAKCDGIINLQDPPSFIFGIPICQPWMTPLNGKLARSPLS